MTINITIERTGEYDSQEYVKVKLIKSEDATWMSLTYSFLDALLALGYVGTDDIKKLEENPLW